MPTASSLSREHAETRQNRNTLAAAVKAATHERNRNRFVLSLQLYWEDIIGVVWHKLQDRRWFCKIVDGTEPTADKVETRITSSKSLPDKYCIVLNFTLHMIRTPYF